MSILIKGMKMPTRCELCPIFNPEEDACSLIGETPWIWADDETCETMHPRPDNCPIIELPPHGRLIDADALYKESCERCLWWAEDYELGDMLDDIKNAPTIIESEEEDDP